MSDFSDLVVYVDESGDHGLESINPEYPVFVLAFVIMKRADYIDIVTPAFQKLKFEFWGHDQIVFHERDIRKKQGPFSILGDQNVQTKFMDDLNSIIEAAPFHAGIVVINKLILKARYSQPWNPYEVALHFCMEKLLSCLQQHIQENTLVHVVFESRGKKEDASLELEFRRITNNQSQWGYKNKDFSYARFEPVFARKDANATGLQLADMIARPCGLKVLRPTQPNRAHQIVLRKALAVGGIKEFP